MRRILIVGLVGAGTALIPNLSAGATPPIHTPPESFEVVISFPDICPFPLTATVRGKQHTATFVDANGNPVRGFLGGQLFVTWTRVDTGISRTFTIAGPSFQNALGEAVRGAGRWTTPMEGVGWVLASGHLTFSGTEGGFALISSLSGTSTPLCDLLA